MAGKFFGIPFASTGDKTAVPDSVQPDGSVSYSEGFGFDYERADTDPAYKPVPREQTNQLYFDLTQAVGIIQKQGFADWTTDAQPYAINAAVRHNGVNWYSLIATNNDEPGVGPGATSWKVLGASVDTINAPISTVAAAGTINLTTGAPDTSQIAISGTGVNINGFTVAANRFFVVKMTGASNTLVNSASLVTGRGANIPVVAGDTFLMRSTAANTVEILCGDFLADAAVGTLGQTWQDVTASRAAATTYTNSTGRPISVCVVANGTGAALEITVAGVAVWRQHAAVVSGIIQQGVSVIVPAGATYSVQILDGSLYRWTELR